MIGIAGLFQIVVTILCIIFVWILLQDVKWDKIFKYPGNKRARMFQVVSAIIIGHLLAQFFLQYWDYTNMLKNLVE